MDDFLHSDDNENVSDVDPEELQKMLEGLDFSDDEKSSKNAKNDPKVPKKSSNLKSSIKVGFYHKDKSFKVEPIFSHINLHFYFFCSFSDDEYYWKW